MKQKYEIAKNDADHQMIIREYGELDKELMSLLCEETYRIDEIRASMSRSSDSLIAALRTQNLFPTYLNAVKIAEAVVGLLSTDKSDAVEIVIDESDYLGRKVNFKEELLEDVEDEPPALDDLLDDDVEEEFDDEIDVGKLGSSLKIADDDDVDVDMEDDL